MAKRGNAPRRRDLVAPSMKSRPRVMNYDELSNEEAYSGIRTHESFNPEIEFSEIIIPQDVLYWMDEFDNIRLAIKFQGLPKP